MPCLDLDDLTSLHAKTPGLQLETQPRLQVMARHLVEVDTIASTTLLKAFGTGMTWRPVLSFLERAADESIRHDTYMLSTAISACESCSIWNFAFHILSSALKPKTPEPERVHDTPIALERSMHAWNSCLAASARGSMWWLGMNTLHQLSLVKLQQDVVSCSSVLHACDVGKRWQNALRVFSGMLEHGPIPNVVASGAAISAASVSARGGEWALQELQRMHRNHLQLSVVCFNAALSACATSFLWAECLALLRDMRDVIHPTMVSFGAAMCAVENVERWAEALGLFTEALQVGLRPSLVAVSSVLAACKHESSMWRMAIHQTSECKRAQVSSMCRFDGLWPPNLIMANALSTACERAGRWQQCAAVLSSLRTWRHRADELTYGNLASSLFADATATWEISVSLLKELGESDLKPDVICLGSALRICELGGVQQAPFVLEMLEGCGDKAISMMKA